MIHVIPFASGELPMFVIENDRPSSEARAEASSARGRRLASLAGSRLRDRFYSWRGVSGRRHVCSVFGAEEESVVAGFSSAVVIGVAREGLTRRPICVLSSRAFDTARGRAIRADAHALGANEWHVHFCGAREGLPRELAAALLS